MNIVRGNNQKRQWNGSVQPYKRARLYVAARLYAGTQLWRNVGERCRKTSQQCEEAVWRCEEALRQCAKTVKWLRGLTAVAALLALWHGLLLWTSFGEGHVHYRPEYEKADLHPIVEKMESTQGDGRTGAGLTLKDYQTLFYQTGLGAAAVDRLWAEGRREELFQYQEDFFREVTVVCKRYNIFVSGEYLAEPAQDAEGNPAGARVSAASLQEEYKKVRIPQLAPLQEGDILVTLCSHCYGWRNGHAAIVVETAASGASKDRTLESVTVGVRSRLRSSDRWRSYPAFAVLRLKEDVSAAKNASADGSEAIAGNGGKQTANTQTVGAQAAALAKDYFCDVPYRLSAGLLGKPWELPEKTESADDAADTVKGTQCAHMIWCCYRALGYDLDSDGGRLVTPRDLLESPLLEVVQIYGMDPAGFLS